ncbi:MAG: hypothetical protein NC419_09230 [Muribaculaceae bacterium]|nr:hypothetical protein [Muribaculaceae bacterium]
MEGSFGTGTLNGKNCAVVSIHALSPLTDKILLGINERKMKVVPRVLRPLLTKSAEGFKFCREGGKRRFL